MKKPRELQSSSRSGRRESGEAAPATHAKCPGCGTRLHSLGRIKVLTGMRPEVRGMMMDPLLAQQQQAVPLEMLVCDGCGRVEFYDASEKAMRRR